MDDRLAASWRQARISEVRENLCELIEQVAAYSGAADDELMSERIAAQQAPLEMLTKGRAELASALSSRDN
jgi:hypothetical protein